MKKFQLTISSPCHENWEEMTGQEKGRFCSSCRKTVVDFTTMSDRQLVQYFRNSRENVCGRLYTDQLDRELVAPPKRLPWIRYFLQLTWPAFMLFLKSCNNRESIMGKTVIRKDTLTRLPNAPILLGITLLELPVKNNHSDGFIHPEKINDSANVFTSPKEDINISETDNTKEKDLLTSRPGKDGEDTMARPMDTVVVTAYSNTGRTTLIMGAISKVSECYINVQERREPQTKQEITKDNYRVYPNPATPGYPVTVSCPTPEDMPRIVQLINNSGQLIMSVNMEAGDAIVFNISIPTTIPSGMYFLRLIKKKENKVHTEKILIN